MTPERWARLQELFAEAVELPESERASYVAALGGEDEELREELARMLEAYDPDSTWPGVGSKASVDRLVGVVLGDYRIEALIGRGGSGNVYRAEQVSKGRAVAVKVLRRDLDVNGTARDRFKREALAASRLSHPNLVRVHYFGEDDDLDYLVMDLVEGPNLREHLVACRAAKPGVEAPRRPDLREPNACAALVRDLARGLQYAHDARVLHRDVKPRNVLIEPDGTPRLTDFGLAKDLELADLTRSGELSGTPQYMSPEQARAARERIDHRTDIYSLGAVLYEMLAGHAPVEGDSTAEVIHNILHRPVAPLYRGNASIPLGLALVCMKALRRNPDKRYATMGEFADDLDRYLDGVTVHATKQSFVERAGERLVDRRVLMKLVPAAGLLGLVGGLALYQGAEVVRARGLRPRVSVLVEGGQSARVSYLALDGHHLPADGERELGVTRDGRLSNVVVPAGKARILVRLDDGRWSEHWRNFEDGTREEIHARPQNFRTHGDRMLLVDGRDVQHPFDPLEDRESTIARGETVTVPPFLLDRRCVTNGEYRAFLEATGRDLPEHWSDRWRSIWQSPPRDDWDELPVVNLTVFEAREYAEWSGKRLPTALEHEIAVGAYGAPPWVDDGAWTVQRLEAVFVLGFDRKVQHDGDTEPNPASAYVDFVRPVRIGERSGPTELCDPVGNVLEWTETSLTATLQGMTNHGQRLGGSAWYDALSSTELDECLFARRVDGPHVPAVDVGFRCARSL